MADKRDRSGKGDRSRPRAKPRRRVADAEQRRATSAQGATPNRSGGAPSKPRRFASERTWRSRQAEVDSDQRADGDSDDRKLLAAATSGLGPGGYRRFADIPAHKLGRKLRIKLYQLAKDLPGDERANLTERIKSAATTVTAGLVTGFGQGTFRSAVRGALESRGALCALQDHLDQLTDLELLGREPREALRAELDEVIASINEFLGDLVRQRERGA